MVECLLAVRVCTMEASRSKSWREPFRGEMRGNWGQKWSQRARRERGGGAIVGAAPARAGHQTDVEGALEVSSFAFMH